MVSSQKTQTWRWCQGGRHVGDHHHELLYERIVVVVPLVRHHRPNYVQHGNVEEILGKYASLEFGLPSLPTWESQPFASGSPFVGKINEMGMGLSHHYACHNGCALAHDSSLYLDAHHSPDVPLQVQPELFHLGVDDLLHARLAEPELAQRRQHEAMLHGEVSSF